VKYIHKKNIPSFFIEDTKNLNNWSEYHGNKKRKLRKYILDNEQNNLCAYCEKIIDIDNCHLEHINPKYNDKINLTFDYQNIIVSCDGICKSSDNPNKKRQTCGHKKYDNFDINLFLNPTKEPKIREYFKYINKGEIKSSSLDINKSEYTLNTLDLNSKKTGLAQDRMIALNNFKNKVIKEAQKRDKDLKELAILLLNKENLAFISFLRYRYKNILF
jgi:uncharacterized protein (TIGR02646 family)